MIEDYLKFAAYIATILAVPISFYLHRRSRVEAQSKITAKVEVDEWKLLVPANYIRERGEGKALRIQFHLFNLSVPQRVVFLKEATIRLWPKFLMFLSKRYTLDPPLLGMTDEEAHTYIASDQPYYYRISADDIVQHIRKSRIRWGFEVELKLIDYDDRSHSVRFPLPSSIVKDIESFLTFNEYIDLFGEKKPKNV